MLKWGQADISMGELPKSGRAHDPFSPLLPFLIGQWSINHSLQHQIWEQSVADPIAWNPDLLCASAWQPLCAMRFPYSQSEIMGPVWVPWSLDSDWVPQNLGLRLTRSSLEGPSPKNESRLLVMSPPVPSGCWEDRGEMEPKSRK